MQVLGPAHCVPGKLLSLLFCQNATALKTIANGFDIPLPSKQVLIAAWAVSASFSKLGLLLPASLSLFLQCIIPLFTISSSCNEMPTRILAHQRTLRVPIHWLSLYCQLFWEVKNIRTCSWPCKKGFSAGFNFTSGADDRDFLKNVLKNKFEEEKLSIQLVYHCLQLL